jgi:hypothetical protein
MSVETAWDYLFYSYKANLPLEGSFRSDLDKLHKAVNFVVESELKDKQKQGAVEELEKLLDWEVKCKNVNLHTENSVPVELIKQRLKWLKEGV